ncbi:MAG: aldo/keto reductase [Dehalococcoidia bacterium]|mgnify:FL=1|nr:aldo/keto reductase [Dehalococcoidia bacterium]|tara:strand:- start:5808 stop:6674 length:867 start_codon:yes stop_codon:yes gene_type:complete
MEKRRLGKTNHHSTVVTFGAYSIGKLTQDRADNVIQKCLDYGVNHIDIAPGYADSMERVAPWMPELRDHMFLGSKTPMRTRDEAWQNIEDIMTRMNVDSFDLFQLHAVIDIETLDQVTSSNGALKALVEMKEQGLTKWLGITGHGPTVPKTHIEALNRFDFDTVMFPVNASMYKNKEYRLDAEKLISICNQKDVGIQTIKMIARGGWGSKLKDLGTWYDPHRSQEEIDTALWWQLSQPIHTAPSCGEYKLLEKILDSAERFKQLDLDEQECIVASQKISQPEEKLALI